MAGAESNRHFSQWKGLSTLLFAPLLQQSLIGRWQERTACYAPRRLQLHHLRGYVVLNIMFFEKRDDLGNICSNADVQKLMLCNLFPVVRKLWLEAEC